MIKNNPIIWILGLIIIVGIIGFSIANPFQQPIKNFKVDYYASYSSGGGDRILNIAYFVRNGIIISCEGTYSFPSSSEQRDLGIYENNVEQCSVQKLKNKEYNAHLELITSVSENQKMSDEVRDGPSIYRYQIIVE